MDESWREKGDDTTANVGRRRCRRGGGVTVTYKVPLLGAGRVVCIRTL